MTAATYASPGEQITAVREALDDALGAYLEVASSAVLSGLGPSGLWT